MLPVANGIGLSNTVRWVIYNCNIGGTMTHKNKQFSPDLTTSLCEIYSTHDHLTEERIIEVLEKYKSIDKYVYILHDKDVYTEEEINNNPNNTGKVGEFKKPHWHVYIHMTSSRTLYDIGKWFGVEWNYVTPPRDTKKSDQFTNMVAYAVHADKKDKYQYDISEVKSKNVDVQAVVNEYLERVNNSKANQKKQDKNIQEQLRMRAIYTDIAQGVIREYNIHEYVDVATFAKFRSKIAAAFEYRRNIISQQNRQMEVYYFQGLPMTGKTTYAKEFLKSKGYSYMVSGSSNDPVQNYKGEDAIILDDFRAENMTVSDLLKLLDNHTNSAVKSRYFDKTIEVKLIIITSVKTIEDLFYNMKNNDNEPIEQLKRRISKYLTFTDKTITIQTFDGEKMSHIEVGTIPNPIPELYPPKVASQEDKDVIASDFIINIEK